MERRIGDLLHVDVGGREWIDQLLAPASRREVALLQERPQRLEMRRDDRLAAATRHEREQRRDDEDALLARDTHQGCEPSGQRRDRRIGLPGAAVGAVADE